MIVHDLLEHDINIIAREVGAANAPSLITISNKVG